MLEGEVTRKSATVQREMFASCLFRDTNVAVGRAAGTAYCKEDDATASCKVAIFQKTAQYVGEFSRELHLKNICIFFTYTKILF
jgi:hypothetical protein